MAAGSDLLQYLIVPAEGASASSILSSSVPNCDRAPSTSKSASIQEESWRARGQLQDKSSHPKKSSTTAKRQKMEIDTPAAVSMHESSNMSGEILSIEEFMAQRKTSAPTVAAEAQSIPEPRAIGARSSKYTIELHEKHQALGIPRPDFVFEGGSMEGWRAKTAFLGRELSVEDPCASKQEAKEKLSEVCLGVVKEMEAAGQLAKAPKTKKQKTENVQPGVVKMEKAPVVNYIGQLLEFQRSTDSPQPTYTDYQLGQSYSCEVTIEKHPLPFGSRTTFFTSKRAARQHAAGCAVKHFQSAGAWPQTYTEHGGIRKKKPSIPNPPIPSPSSDSNTPTPLASTDSIDTATGASSYAQRVAHLATQLSLESPEWRYTPSSTIAPGFHTVCCYFKNGGPHEGPIGEVRHVFGKKKAKEECARLVLQYLQAVKEKRLDYARGMMARMKGDTEMIASRVVGKKVEGEALITTGKQAQVP